MRWGVRRRLLPLRVGVIHKLILKPHPRALRRSVGFVVWNDGIVLGNKSHCVLQLHIPQIFYFVGFCTVLAPVVLWLYCSQALDVAALSSGSGLEAKFSKQC